MSIQQTITQKAETVFPWLEALSSDEVQMFYDDIFTAIEQALASGDWQILQTTIEDWQATAKITDSPLETLLTVSSESGTWHNWEDVRATLHSQP